MTRKELDKNIATISHYDYEMFVRDANRYIGAITESRMICSIHSVSASGMTRNLSFHSLEKGLDKYWLSQYYCLFLALGYKYNKNKECFIISGCGMNMVFHTNYSIIHQLYSLELITKEQCEHLCQQTPFVL